MKMITIVLMLTICTAFAETTPTESPINSDYVCTNRFFSVPESFDLLNVEQAQELVRANSARFESHLILAGALIKNGQMERALDQFKLVDELASKVKDPQILAGLEYEGLYAFTLFVAAERRLKQDINDLYTLRMLQQVLGMDHSKLEQEGLLPRCYLYVSTLYVKRGAYRAAIHTSELGKRIAEEKKDAESVRLFDTILKKANKLKKE